MRLMPQVGVGGTSVTVMVAVPDLVVSSVEVALTVRVEAVSPTPTVKRPAALMVEAPPLDPSTVQVTVCAGELVPATVAAKV